jgi:hypothetical protein
MSKTQTINADSDTRLWASSAATSLRSYLPRQFNFHSDGEEARVRLVYFIGQERRYNEGY